MKDTMQIDRRPTTQDLTWLLDLQSNNQLDLDPPYQRRSVWTRRDRQFFLDTIFRNYPCPAIFLHKTISDTGKTTYHVVDGKQRTETILKFVADEIRLANDFGDNRLDGKKWSELDSEIKRRLWNYQVTIEIIDIADGNLVNVVFDRLNRNAIKLNKQELRHAKYDGWFINEAEKETEREEWEKFKVVTSSRARRMLDVQFISELLLLVLENRVHDFSQDNLDALYAKYDYPTDSAPDFNEDAYRASLTRARSTLRDMEEQNQVITRRATNLAHIYSLWSLVVLNPELPAVPVLAEAYESFMTRVDLLASHKDLPTFLRGEGENYGLEYLYWEHARLANTDLAPRERRYQALLEGVLHRVQ